MKNVSLKWFAVVWMFTVLGNTAAVAAQDEKAEASLLSAIFPSNCSFSGLFSQQKAISGVPAPLKSAGDFFYACDLGLVWHTSEPFSEAVLYVNSTNNFKAEDDGTLTPLSGVARYVMSNIFVPLLQGETSYFTQEFTVSQEDNGSILLLPESETMQKGLQAIRISRADETSTPPTVNIKVTDATGQETQVAIEQIQKYDSEGMRKAYEQCLEMYSDKKDWCRVLRSPSRYDAF